MKDASTKNHMVTKLDEQDVATIVAALRLWQNRSQIEANLLRAIQDEVGSIVDLHSNADIDILAEVVYAADSVTCKREG